MKNLGKTILIAFTLSTTIALADNSSASVLDINQVLPKTITAVENPIPPHSRKNVPVSYSPQQKAKIAGLELKSNQNNN